ncbi:MAG TPA: heavy metal translocating P-type ATPase [Actinomycetota bacterium]|nr:heavy metal translocating P-type ATPase [Actinomycetota bacterium]
MKRSPNTTPSRTEPDASPKLAPGLASESTGPWRRSLRHPLLLLVVAGITSGIVAAIAGASGTATLLWAGTTIVALVPLTIAIARDLLRGRAGVDVIALLAMGGALLLGEQLAGSVVALMLVGGQTLEEYAGGRARRELSQLAERMPRFVRRREGGGIVSRPLESVIPGDLLLVRTGEVLPVDGLVTVQATLDESTLTGESRPVEHPPGEPVASGTVNIGPPFDLQATATAQASTYAGIVRLVREAQTSKAPFVRMADRYAMVFLPLTVTVATAAWAFSGDPVRALAVLVVATPCPLILAAPVALVSGISRAARRGVIVKGGGPLEALANARTLLVDKTGTLTAGTPSLREIEVFGRGSGDELLRMAASLEQVSPHTFAAPITRAAEDRGLTLSFPTDSSEKPGTGVRGTVDGTEVRLGSATWALPEDTDRNWLAGVRRRASSDGSSTVFVGVENGPQGVLIMEDPVRPDARSTLESLRSMGIRRIVMLTGDDAEVARIVGESVGTDEVLAECSPEEKVRAITREGLISPTLMVGDGINDAPALAAAGVGIALGARGLTAHSEAADVVITVDRLDRVSDAIRIARRAKGIALQSVIAGMGMSGAAMVAAAAGLLTPLAGALLQEAIDVAVILNALRALGDGRQGGAK